MIIITMDKALENYDIERLGKIYARQAEEGVIVIPNGAKAEELITADGMECTLLFVDEEHKENSYEDEEDKE